MQTKMLVDLNETVRKGDPAPKGQEARFVRAGLAAKVTSTPTKTEAPKKAKAKATAKPKAKSATVPVAPIVASAVEPTEA